MEKKNLDELLEKTKDMKNIMSNKIGGYKRRKDKSEKELNKMKALEMKTDW